MKKVEPKLPPKTAPVKAVKPWAERHRDSIKKK